MSVLQQQLTWLQHERDRLRQHLDSIGELVTISCMHPHKDGCGNNIQLPLANHEPVDRIKRGTAGTRV